MYESNVSQKEALSRTNCSTSIAGGSGGGMGKGLIGTREEVNVSGKETPSISKYWYTLKNCSKIFLIFT